VLPAMMPIEETCRGARARAHKRRVGRSAPGQTGANRHLAGVSARRFAGRGGLVAEIIGVPQSTVETCMFYARKRIAELMAAQGIDRAIV
jgi:hypothetical protein